MALALHVPAHDAETHHRSAIPGNKGRNDGVEGAFAATHLVGMAGLQGECTPAVLQADTGFRHDQAGAEAVIVALDK